MLILYVFKWMHTSNEYKTLFKGQEYKGHTTLLNFKIQGYGSAAKNLDFILILGFLSLKIASFALCILGPDFSVIYPSILIRSI